MAASNHSSVRHASSTTFIHCWPRDTEETTRLSPAACREIYSVIRDLPDYRTTQIFQEGVRPRFLATDPTSVPPFGLSPSGEHGSCTLVLQAEEGPEIDKFSWHQVVRAAGEIADQCATEGAGGFVWIGEDYRWVLELSLYEPALSLGFGGSGSRNWKGFQVGNGTPGAIEAA